MGRLPGDSGWPSDDSGREGATLSATKEGADIQPGGLRRVQDGNKIAREGLWSRSERLRIQVRTSKFWSNA